MGEAAVAAVHAQSRGAAAVTGLGRRLKQAGRTLLRSPKKLVTAATGAVCVGCVWLGGAIGFNAVASAALITAGLAILLVKLGSISPKVYRALLGGRFAEVKRLAWDVAAFGLGFLFIGGTVTGTLMVGVTGLMVSTLLFWLPKDPEAQDEPEAE